MKKKLVVLMMVGMLALTFGVGTSNAAVAWYSVLINEVGSSIGTPYMMVTDAAATPTFTSLYVFFDSSSPSAMNQMLAACLTAFANSSNCKIYFDPAVGVGSTVFSAAAAK